MSGSHSSIVFLSLAVLGVTLVPAKAAAAVSPLNPSHGPRSAKSRTCAKAPIEVAAGTETETFALADCDGKAMRSAVDELSILARPATALRPDGPSSTQAKTHDPEFAPGIRRFDPRLVERLQLAVDHFAKDGQPTKVVLVSGYRPKNSGSYHFAGRAIDFRIDGVKDGALAAFCKTLADTGCGYYPNNVFVHMDVRDPGTGHVSWTDASAAQTPANGAAPGDLLDAKKNPVPADSRDKSAETPASSPAPDLSLARPIEKCEADPGAKQPALPRPVRGRHRHAKKRTRRIAQGDRSL